MSAQSTTARSARHALGLERHAAGDHEAAAALLREALTESLDPELVNDLAVVLASAGMTEQARQILLGLGQLAPSYEPAPENLAQLPAAPPASAADEAIDGMDEARMRFLQLVAESAAATLPDNLDHHFHPLGHPLPDPAQAGRRLHEQLRVLARCGALWRNLGDEASGALLLRFLAYRALGPAHVRLQLEPQAYYRDVGLMTAKMLRQAGVLLVPGAAFEWQLHHYDLEQSGTPVQVVGSQLSLASTYMFSQYAYRDETAGAGPAPGDVVIDGGGCWGETALWFAHMVGEAGHVYTFEPGAENRRLLEHNLALNPALRERISLQEAPLGARAGETVWIRDVLHPGVELKSAGELEGRSNVAGVKTDTIDAFVAREGLAAVDLVKLDVEWAEVAAIEGAAATIRRHQPKLAIACYHGPDQVADIPAAVAALGVRYRWYLQCSTMTDVDTVAFGVPA